MLYALIRRATLSTAVASSRCNRGGCCSSAALALLLAAGCTRLGPDFTTPPPPVDPGWTSASLALVPQAPRPGPWWQAFEDPALDALLAQGLAANPDFRIAGLRVLEARALQAAARAGRLPQAITATAAAGYGANAPTAVPLGQADFAFGAAGLGVTWELDLWGRFARAIEGADAAYFASIATQEDVALLLRAEIARLYLTHRTLQERLEAARENIALQERSVEITGLRFREGDAGELDFQQALTQLLATRASVPAIEAGLVSTANGLALLLGRPPGPIPELALGPPRLPPLPPALGLDVPVGTLLLRPDVRAAFFSAAAQSTRIGIQKAELYPALALTGSVDLTRTTLGGLSATNAFTLGPAVRWNIIDLGRIRSLVRAEDARFQQALEAYRRAALNAATEVDNAAVTLVKAREEGLVLEQSLAAARRSLALAQLRYREGLSDFQRVLDAQAALVRQQDRLIANRGDTAIAYVTLAAALGGGNIAASEADFASPETREAMKARTNWGTLLDPAGPPP